DPVPQILEVLHLPDQHRVAEVQIGRCRVEADLDHQRLTGGCRPLQLRPKLTRADDVHTSFREIGQLLVNRHWENKSTRRGSKAQRPKGSKAQSLKGSKA